MTEEVIAAMLERLSEAMDGVGQGIVEDIQQAIGTQFPPSGPAGGNPARRTGQLQRGVIHYQEQLSTEIVEYIHSTRPPEFKHDDPDVPEYVEFGRSGTPERPYMRLASDRVMETLGDDIASRIS